MRSLLRTLSVVLATIITPVTTFAQELPAGPYRIIVPFAAGDAIDNTARLLADLMEDELSAPVIVQNIPGGGGAAGTAEAARATPDGTTMLIASTGATTARPLISDSGYETDDFKAIANIVDVPIALGVAASSPYQTLEDLVAAAKEETLTYATPAPGSTQHISMETFARDQGMSLTHIGGQGGRGAVTKALSGEVDFAFVGATVFTGLAEGGQLRMLGVAAEQPVTYLDAPTFADAGYDFEATVWFGLVVPSEVPAETTEALREVVSKVATSDDAAELYTQLNFTPNVLSGEEFQARIDDSVASNREILTDLGMIKR